MTDETQIKKKQQPWFSKVAIALITAVLVFTAQQGLSTLSSLREDMISVKTEMKQLKEDDAKWATLAELKNQQTEMQVRIAVQEALNRNNRQTLLEIIRGNVDFEVLPPEEMEALFKRLEELEKAKSNRPKIRIPEETRLIDPDSFRRQMEQRYPSKAR